MSSIYSIMNTSHGGLLNPHIKQHIKYHLKHFWGLSHLTGCVLDLIMKKRTHGAHSQIQNLHFNNLIGISLASYRFMLLAVFCQNMWINWKSWS